MKKFLKCLAVLIAIGAFVGVIIAFLCKNKEDEDLFDSDLDLEDEDLDSDLQAVERGYVPLKKSVSDESAEKTEVKEDTPSKTTIEESTDIKQDSSI